MLISLQYIVQQLCLQHPVISQKLGLVQKSVNVSVNSEGNVNGSTLPDAPRKRGPVSAFDLSPLQLVDVSCYFHERYRVSPIYDWLMIALFSSKY